MTGEIVTDLFGGLRQLPSGGRGRPAHRWSQDKEDRVLLGLAMGYSDAEIALGLEISVPTLRKHYFSALKRREMQRTRFELWRADVLARQANLGNVGAVKELGKIMERRDRYLADLRLQGRGEPEPKKGKKELRREAAERAAEGAADGWGDLLNPSVH
jgi:hypothetical protein